MRLSLTADGRAVLGTLQQQARQLNTGAMAGLTAAGQQQLLALLQRVRATWMRRSDELPQAALS